MSELRPLAERTIGEYLETLGSSRPAPGGGSVAGLVGALAAGLGQMVISLTVKSAANPGLENQFGELQDSISSLLSSAAEDELAYAGYVDASRLPKATGDEKATRRTAMQAALINAAEVPLAMAETADTVLELLEPVAREGTSHALSDAFIAASLAHASVVAALANVRINIPLIKDGAIAQNLAARADNVEITATERASLLRSILEERRSD